MILIRCGLRASDACTLAFDCLLHDGQGAPYLRYLNHKMKRETRPGGGADPTPVAPYLRYLPWLRPGEGRGLREWSGTCLTSIRNSFVPAATFAT